MDPSGKAPAEIACKGDEGNHLSVTSKRPFWPAATAQGFLGTIRSSAGTCRLLRKNLSCHFFALCVKIPSNSAKTASAASTLITLAAAIVSNSE